LAGTKLFDGASDFELMRQHVYEAPRPLRQVRADVPEALEALVLDLTAKQPEQRPRDAYEVYDRLLPFLPEAGTRPPAVGLEAAGVPDPTRLYRQPNAPRPRTVTGAPDQAAPPSAPSPSAALATELRGAIRAAISHSDALLDAGRYAQAAEALHQVIEPAAEALGIESPRVLRLRQRRAAILVIGGNFRAALPEFDDLYTAFVRTGGSTSNDALECLREAAHCRAELGQATVALRQFRQVLTQVSARDGDVSDEARELRRNIATLLLAEGDTVAAVAELTPLHEDLVVLYGPDHEETREIAGILARLRASGGQQQRGNGTS
jgi:hypothetical protein